MTSDELRGRMHKIVQDCGGSIVLNISTDGSEWIASYEGYPEDIPYAEFYHAALETALNELADYAARFQKTGIDR